MYLGSILVGIVFLASLGLSFLICRMGTFTHIVDFIGILEQTWHIEFFKRKSEHVLTGEHLLRIHHCEVGVWLNW